MLAKGIPCSLGTDDPLMFRASLLDEYTVCRTKMGLSDQQLALLAANSFKYSGAPAALKAEAERDIERWLAMRQLKPWVVPAALAVAALTIGVLRSI